MLMGSLNNQPEQQEHATRSLLIADSKGAKRDRSQIKSLRCREIVVAGMDHNTTLSSTNSLLRRHHTHAIGIIGA